MKKIFTQIDDPRLNVVDSATGEIISAVKRVKAETIDDFMMVFLNGLNYLFKLDGKELKVLMCCWKASSISTMENSANLFANNVVFKNYVRKQGLELSDSAIDNYVHKLAKKGTIKRMCKGYYMLNPDYFFKGRLSERSKLKLELEYNP